MSCFQDTSSMPLMCQLFLLLYACSAGKSLVAEVLLIRRVIDTGKKALLVLPFVSICHEKVQLHWKKNPLLASLAPKSTLLSSPLYHCTCSLPPDVVAVALGPEP